MTTTAYAAATALPPPMSFRDVLRIDVMRRVWYAQVVSLFGDFLALFAVIAVVSFRLRATPNQITGVQISYMLPIVFVGPLAGVFVDRWPLKPTLISSDLIRAVLAALPIFTTSLWQVYLVLAALSCVSAFFGPAQGVTIRSHVPIPRPTEASRSRIHGIWIDMKAGTAFIFHHAPILFVVLAMAAGLFTIGCFGPLIAIFVRATLHASARSFGIVSGMVGVGMLVGTQLVRQMAKSVSNDALVLSGLAGIGGAVLLLGEVPHIAATITSTFLLGFAFAAIIVPAQTLIQRETPPDMLGRVGSTNASIVFLGQILGLAASGVLAEAIGVRLVFFLCAGLALVLVGAGRLFLHAKS